MYVCTKPFECQNHYTSVKFLCINMLILFSCDVHVYSVVYRVMKQGY